MTGDQQGEPRWLRIQCEVYPMARIASVRCLDEDGTSEVWVFDTDGENLACAETKPSDIGEHRTLDEAMAAAAAWDFAAKMESRQSDLPSSEG